jgi:hypothetical protein
MKKTPLKTKLVLHAQTIMVLVDKDLVRVAAGQTNGANADGDTKGPFTCPAAPVIRETA